MKISEVIARLPAWYYSALEPGGPSYHIEGPPGGAKTTALMQFPKIMKKVDPEGNYGTGYINGGNFTLMTAMGFMIPKEEHGRDVSKFTLPYWYYAVDEQCRRLKKLLSDYDGGLLVIDEIDKMGLDEKKITGETALSKVLGDHFLSEGWVPMFAGNRAKDRSGSTRDLDHLINRRITIEITPDAEGWAEWARGAGLLSEVITFAEENPHLLYEPQPEDQRPFCSPRSLHQTDIHLQSLMRSYATDKVPTDALTHEELKGGIGAPAAAQLIKTINLGQETPDFKEVVAKPTTTEVPKRPDVLRLTAYKLAAKTSVENAAAIMKYVGRMPQEHQVMFVRMAMQRNYALTFQPDFARFCGQNAQLISILTRYRVDD